MQLILKYFPELSQKQITQFFELQDLYLYWNSKVNVVSRKDIAHLYLNHVLHSLSIAKIIHFKKGTKVLDVGTGGGFPGIPLAILYPDVDFFLLDSIGKKVRVVNDISSSIGLVNVCSINDRVENITETFDFVISRAVTNMTQFRRWVFGKFTNRNINDLENGILYLKGGDLSEELKGIKHVQYRISDFFEETFFQTKKVIYVKG